MHRLRRRFGTGIHARARHRLGNGGIRHAAGATHTRNDREAARGKQGGRTVEIQRLIGRGLRAVVDMSALGERTIRIDCDVLQADGDFAYSVYNRGCRGACGRDRYPARSGVRF